MPRPTTSAPRRTPFRTGAPRPQMLARLRGAWHFRRASVRSTPRIVGRPQLIFRDGAVVLGRGVEVRSDVARVEIVVEGRLDIGDGVILENGCSIGASDHVVIGPGTRVGPHVQIMDNAFHRLEPERRNERPASEPVSIGSDVWIGAMAIILPGVTIGDGAVVRPRTVVTRDVPARTCVTGLPAAPARS